MKQTITLFALLFLSLTTINAQDDECTSDATWEETIQWLQENVKSSDLAGDGNNSNFKINITSSHITLECLHKKVYNTRTTGYLEGLSKVGPCSVNNCLYLSELRVEKIFTREPITSNSEYMVRNAMTLSIASGLLNERALKAFNHLVHLNKKRMEKSNSKF